MECHLILRAKLDKRANGEYLRQISIFKNVLSFKYPEILYAHIKTYQSEILLKILLKWVSSVGILMALKLLEFVLF